MTIETRSHRPAATLAILYLHVARGQFRFFLEIDLVTAGPQRRGGRVFQPFDGRPFFLLQVDQILVENSQNAVQAAINLLDLFRIPSGLLDHASHAGVNDRRRPARLRDQ